MTEEKNVMQDALVSIIQKTQQGIDASVSFLSEQIPDVVQQLLIWKASEALVWALIQLFFGVLGLLLVQKGIKGVSKQLNLDQVAESTKDIYCRTTGDSAEKKKAYQEAEKAASAHHLPLTAGIVGGVVGVIFIAAFLFNFWDNLLTIVQIWVAPKIYLIEYATKLIK